MRRHSGDLLLPPVLPRDVLARIVLCLDAGTAQALFFAGLEVAAAGSLSRQQPEDGTAASVASRTTAVLAERAIQPPALLSPDDEGLAAHVGRNMFRRQLFAEDDEEEDDPDGSSSTSSSTVTGRSRGGTELEGSEGSSSSKGPNDPRRRLRPGLGRWWWDQVRYRRLLLSRLSSSSSSAAAAATAAAIPFPAEVASAAGQPGGQVTGSNRVPFVSPAVGGRFPDRCFSFVPVVPGIDGPSRPGDRARTRMLGAAVATEREHGGDERDDDDDDDDDGDHPPVHFECDCFLLPSPTSSEFLLLHPGTGQFVHGLDLRRLTRRSRRRRTSGATTITRTSQSRRRRRRTRTRDEKPATCDGPIASPSQSAIAARSDVAPTVTVLHPGRSCVDRPDLVFLFAEVGDGMDRSTDDAQLDDRAPVAGNRRNNNISSRNNYDNHSRRVSEVIYIGIECKHIVYVDGGTAVHHDDNDDDDDSSGGGGSGRCDAVRCTVAAVGRQLVLRSPDNDAEAGAVNEQGQGHGGDGPVVTEVFSWERRRVSDTLAGDVSVGPSPRLPRSAFGSPRVCRFRHHFYTVELDATNHQLLVVPAKRGGDSGGGAADGDMNNDENHESGGEEVSCGARTVYAYPLVPVDEDSTRRHGSNQARKDECGEDGYCCRPPVAELDCGDGITGLACAGDTLVVSTASGRMLWYERRRLKHAYKVADCVQEALKRVSPTRSHKVMSEEREQLILQSVAQASMETIRFATYAGPHRAAPCYSGRSDDECVGHTIPTLASHTASMPWFNFHCWRAESPRSNSTAGD
jgi:hypothetical protein